MKKRQGFLMIELLAGLMAVSVTVLAVFSVFYRLAAYEEEREAAADEIWIAQQVLETEKYNLAFHENEAVPVGQTARNGRVYDVVLEKEAVTVERVPMMKVTCRVSMDGKRPFAASFLWGEQ